MSKHPQLNSFDTQVNFPLLMNARQLALPIPQLSKPQQNSGMQLNSIVNAPFVLPPIQNPHKFDIHSQFSNNIQSLPLVSLPPITNYPQVTSTSITSNSFTVAVENSVSEERETKRIKTIAPSTNQQEGTRAFKKHFKIFQEPFDQQRKS